MDWYQNEVVNKSIEGFRDALADPSVQFGLIAVAFVLFVLFFLRRRQPAKILAYQSDNGRVMVSRSAIVELVHSACTQVEKVHRPTVHIRCRRGVCNLKVGIKLESGGKLRDLENTLQHHLRQALTDTLGIEQLGVIDVTATGFKGKKGPNPSDYPDGDNNLSDFR